MSATDPYEYMDVLTVTHTNCGHTIEHVTEPRDPSFIVHMPIETETTCAPCKLGEAMRDAEAARDKRAAEYLNRKGFEKFVNSPTERFRRWVHNALHRVQYAMGHKFCVACNMLTHNRLEPHQIDHVRPASHDGVI